MNAGFAQIDITPESLAGIELSGFASRMQPCAGVLDAIFVKCTYLEHGAERLLWVCADVLAFDFAFVAAFRAWAREFHHLGAGHVVVSATHTHSAPAMVALTGCGSPLAPYAAMLQSKLRECASAAIRNRQPAELVVSETTLELAIDRRAMQSAHVDPRMLALGWRDPAGRYIGILLNYAMHPVTLGHENRRISADWCGRAAAAMSKSVPGEPISIVLNGACGNLNPPLRGNDPELIESLGQAVAKSGSEAILGMQASSYDLAIRRCIVDLPLESLSHDAIDKLADAQLAKDAPDPRWKNLFRRTIEVWRGDRHREIDQNLGRSAPIELLAIRIGPFALIAITGEIFSRFSGDISKRVKVPVYTVGYSNGVFGYIPTSAAYDEGGYEPDMAHYFYNTFRAKRGGHELLVDRAVELVNAID